MKLGDDALDTLFRQARTHSRWRAAEVTDAELREIYEVASFGPTSANSNPARFVFVRSKEAKTRLKPHLSQGNVDKTMAAACCVIVAYDLHFHDRMPELFPGRDVRGWFLQDQQVIEETAFRNSTLQGAYLIVAARALGFDCGPLSGFDPKGVDAEFFPDGRLKSNFLINLGRGDESALLPRLPRLVFNAACGIV
jgi:3-hydroxypropanoate dehydrogenase